MTNERDTPQPQQGYLGIDIGTQGLSVLWTDPDTLQVVATADGAPYDCTPGLPPGHYEQNASDWDNALRTALEALRKQLSPEEENTKLQPLAIGISGQMHGAVLLDSNSQPLAPVRIWCDARNAEASQQLTNALGCKIPQRATAARLLGWWRDDPAVAAATRRLTTPAGWITYRLTGEWRLGVGDAAGMFPIDPTTGTFDPTQIATFDRLVLGERARHKGSTAAETDDDDVTSLASLLPTVESVYSTSPPALVTAAAAAEFGVQQGTVVAAGEGDQVAALAGSLVGASGAVACSFGTSVCANIVGPPKTAFHGISPAVDHFGAADGTPLHMVWLRNGTTFLNTMVQGDFATAMPALLKAPPDCGGLLALPFAEEELGLGISASEGCTSMVVGFTSTNATIGNIAKAALLATMFNLKLGCQVLQDQGFPLEELILTGGLSKTPSCGQILADVFGLPVILLDDSADEGSGWGAAVIAKYRHLRSTNGEGFISWPDFLDELSKSTSRTRFEPDQNAVGDYHSVFCRYKRLLELHGKVSSAVKPGS